MAISCLDGLGSELDRLSLRMQWFAIDARQALAVETARKNFCWLYAYQHQLRGASRKPGTSFVLDDLGALQVPMVLGALPPPHLQPLVMLIRSVSDSGTDTANTGAASWVQNVRAHEVSYLAEVLANLKKSPL